MDDMNNYNYSYLFVYKGQFKLNSGNKDNITRLQKENFKRGHPDTIEIPPEY